MSTGEKPGDSPVVIVVPHILVSLHEIHDILNCLECANLVAL